MSSINQEIDTVAADWVARRDLGILSAKEEAEFGTWLAADIRHLGAYGRAEAVLCRLEPLNSVALDPALYTADDQAGWNRRRILLAGGAAVSVAAAATVGLFLSRDGTSEWRVSTQIGQMREVVLQDGSIVSLNTNSEIAVHFTKDARNISLLRGEALFDVAKNRNRPFIVSAGDTQVRAVGTSFTVSRLPQKPIQILVREGIVELQRANSPGALPVRASANIQAISSPGAPIVTVAMPEEKLARGLEWQHGRIALDNETLADAAAEFARYSEVRISVDAAVSSRTVTGLFASNDPVGFARAAASVLKLQTEVSGNEVRIFAGKVKSL
jgi:transmembrane sensor